MMPLRTPVLAVCLLAAPAALAAEGDVWRQVADGATITVAEVRANSGRAFDAIDSDGDDIVTQAEFIDHPLPSRLGGYANRDDLRADLFDRIDLNSNGTITSTEWRDAIHEDVSIADSDDDGRVTLHELATADLGSVIVDFFD